MMTLHKTIRLLLLALFMATGSAAARTGMVDDWGTIATPVTSEVTFSFAQYDIGKNFTDQYNFSLQGGAGATYSVTFAFEPCRRGCGNPDLTYGIYDRNGSLIASTNGSVTLSAGNYAFQVKGIGMGAGNTVDYWGSVTFTAGASAPGSLTSVTMVSPAPEPSTLVMMLIGLAFISWSIWRQDTLLPSGVRA
jgi:hypothetical protein